MYIQSKATTIYHNLGHCIVAASGNIVLTRATVIAKVDTSETPDFGVYLWKYYNGAEDCCVLPKIVLSSVVN